MLTVFPVLVLLLVHIGALRLQSVVVNGVHHTALAADLLLLVWYFFRQDGGRATNFWRTPWSQKLRLCWLPALLLGMDVAWLNVPSPDAGATVRSDILKYAGYDRNPNENLLVRWTRVLLALPIQPVDLLLCYYLKPGWGCRYLTLSGRPLVARVWDAKTFVELRGSGDADEQHLATFEAASLRGRVLRFAVLEGSELFGADLSGAQLQGADLGGTSFQAAKLRGAQLQGAYLGKARLEGAQLHDARLQGADLWAARLQGAYLQGAQLQGASLEFAHLEGAILAEAGLQGADLTGATLQGADLNNAQLQGTRLNAAQLQATDLQSARLWNAEVDSYTQMGLADLRGVEFDVGLTDEEKTALLASVPDERRSNVMQALVARVDAGMLPRVSTDDGPLLVDTPRRYSLRNLGDAQVMADETDFAAKLGSYLAEKVATTRPEAAENIAWISYGDTSRPDIPDLGCRLLALEDGGKVRLRPDTISALRRAAGQCR